MTLAIDTTGEKFVNGESKCKQNTSECVVDLRKLESINCGSRRLKEYLKKLWAFRGNVTVEPFVVCYMLPSMLVGLAVQKLSLEKACLVNLEYDEQTCKSIMAGDTQNFTKEERNVQFMVAQMSAWSYPLQTALPGILSLFLGAWSDRTGNRKRFMVLPILGKFFSVAGLILTVVFFNQINLNETALIDGLPPVLAGGRIAMTTAVYSYITDVTLMSERTFRIGILTATLTLSRHVGLALSGVMTKRFGYYGVFVTSGAFYSIGFVYILIRIRDKSKKAELEQSGSKTTIWMFEIKDLAATVKVAIKPRQSSRRIQIMIIIFAYMLIVGPVLGESQMTYWFTRYKFKFSEIDFSLFLTFSVLVSSIGSFISLYLFSKRWLLEDSTIGALACVSRVCASLVYAVAPTREVYFLGPVLDMFSSAGAAALRSSATKLVSDHEVGKVSSLVSIAEALVPVVYSPLYARVYQATLATLPGAFYLISTALALPALLLLLVLRILHKREVRNTQADSHIKPESEITKF